MSEVPAYVESLGLTMVRPAEIWTEGSSGYQANVGIGILDVLREIFDDFFRYQPKYPVKVRIPELPSALGTFWASVLGEFPAHVKADVVESFKEPLEIDDACIKGVGADLSDLLAQDILFPRRISGHGISVQMQSGRDHCVFFMDAANIGDILDYWNLRATGRSVYPLPKQFLGDAAVRANLLAFIRAIKSSGGSRDDYDIASIIRSRHSTMAEMEAFLSDLRNDHQLTITPDDRFSLQHWYPRIWDEWARNRDGGIGQPYGNEEESIDVEAESDQPLQLRTLIPKVGKLSGPRPYPRCANEVDLRFFGGTEPLAEVLPKFSGQKYLRSISGITSLTGDWRVGRNGLVKLVRHEFTERRPPLLAEPIFFAWLADHGWTAELSTAGHLAKQMLRALKGYASFLKNEKVLGLIEYMNGGSVKQDLTPGRDAGTLLSGERELPVAEVKSRLKSKNGRIHDDLTSMGMFKLGLRTKCPNCFRDSWYALNSLGDRLSCPKCLTMFASVGIVDGGTWCYKTSGPFSVPRYGDGAYAVLLASEFLGEHGGVSCRTTRVLSFCASGPGQDNIEADLAAFWRDGHAWESYEGVLFGECKTYGTFEQKDFRRIQRLAQAFPGAVLVFATLKKVLNPREVAGIRRIARAGRKHWKTGRPINPVLVLTGTELLNWRRPPGCWSEELEKRFRNIFGLLSLCNATQQIYLGLRPWEQDWHDSWERRRQRAVQHGGVERG